MRGCSGSGGAVYGGVRFVNRSIKVNYRLTTHREVAPFCANLEQPQPPFLVQTGIQKLAVIVGTETLFLVSEENSPEKNCQ